VLWKNNTGVLTSDFNAFKTSWGNIPNDVPYIYAEESKKGYWKDKLAVIPGPKIGLVWSGGFRPNNPELWGVNQRRNISFELISQLNIEGIEFFSLQKGEGAEAELKKYQQAQIIWCQEEPKNMGAWLYIIEPLEQILTNSKHLTSKPKYVGRVACASPATGYGSYHSKEQKALINEALDLPLI
jgi:hypothetical protein